MNVRYVDLVTLKDQLDEVKRLAVSLDDGETRNELVRITGYAIQNYARLLNEVNI
tara:strand:+ start:612 stop:776 length:165 start_codon:yes stop_codon:yes gene_type:complete